MDGRDGSSRRPTLIGVLVLVVALAGLPTSVAAQSNAPRPDGLSVLLTNDNGYQAEGLLSMRDALVAAGHRVTVVAPLDERSGSSSSITRGGLIDYYEQEEGVWAIDGTPSDAVTLGLVHIMRENPPDLVVSGLSRGQNVGAGVLRSGTVGAALTAARSGVPAIAASVEVDLGEREGSVPFASTVETFASAAAFVVEVIRQLSDSDAEGLLAPRVVLNVNYPAVGERAPAGVRFATVASVRAFRNVFSVAGSTGPARVELTAADPARAEEGSDYALLAEDYVTISVLDGSLDAGQGSWASLLERLIIER